MNPRFLLFTFLSLLAAFSRGDLVAHYDLDETDPGSSVVADSLLQNEGVLIGSSNPTKNFTSPLGTGYNFPTASGFRINPAPEVQPTDQFTITWWFRPTTRTSFDRLYETLSGTGNNGSGIRIDLGSTGTNLRCLLRDGNGSTNTTVQHPLNLNSGVWYFFALRYD
ncbi:MAG: hypothetical protein PVJ98_02100, partial [Akkermansiaceae bacterium]